MKEYPEQMPITAQRPSSRKLKTGIVCPEFTMKKLDFSLKFRGQPRNKWE